MLAPRDRPLESTSDGVRRQRSALLAMLFVAYVGYYLCRVSFNVVKPVLETEFGFDKSHTGLIVTTYFVVYSISKLVNGFVGDRVGGKLLLLVGIFGSVTCNLLIGSLSSPDRFLWVWSANAFFQAMGWLSMMAIVSRWYRSDERGCAIGGLSLSYTLGDVLARFVGGLILMWLSFSSVFLVHAGLVLLIGFWLIAYLRPTPVGQTEPPRAEYGAHLSRMLSNSALWIACALYLALSTLRYVFWIWSIEHLSESCKSLDIGGAAIASAIYPLFGSAGVLFAGRLSDRNGGRRGPVLCIMTLLVLPCVYAYGSFETVAGGDVAWMILLLGLIGFLLHGPYSLLAGAMAVDFGSRYSSASAAGIMDSVGAIGAIGAGYGMGTLIDRFGWSAAFYIVSLIALSAGLMSLRLWKFEPPRDPASATSIPQCDSPASSTP